MILQSRINALGRQRWPVSAVDYFCLECKRVVQLPWHEEAVCPVCLSELIKPGEAACGGPVAWVDGRYVWR